MKEYAKLTRETKKTIAQNATREQSKKLAAGETAQFRVYGNKDNIDFIKETIKQTGLPITKALVLICEFYKENK